MSGPSYVLDDPISQEYEIPLLSQRDVSLQIPINFVTAPAISITAACFAHGVYDFNAAGRCFENLLSMGYRRMIIDLYWDQVRRVWALCPAEIPVPGPTSTTVPLTVTSTSTKGLASGSTLTRAATTASGTSSPEEQPALLAARQAVETFTSLATDSLGSVSTATQLVTVNPQITSASTLSSSASASATTPDDGESQITLGPYSCNPDVDLTFLVRQMNSYFAATSDTIAAQIKYLIFNIHSASPVEDPTMPGLSPDEAALPSQQEFIGAQFNADLSAYMYTPALLAEQRANIGRTWTSYNNLTSPDISYYTETADGLGASDGWPSESYVEFKQYQRLLLGIGTIDPQMQNYNQGLDDGLVFDNSSLVTLIDDISFNENGRLENGCIFNPRNATPAAANNSNALTTILPPSAFQSQNLLNVNLTIDSVSDLTSCGISYLLNETLLNRTADTDPELYRNFALSAIMWSWARGEPLGDSAFVSNASSNGSSGELPADFRCAVQDAQTQGRWKTAFCDNNLHGACRSSVHPYEWSVSEDTAGYRQLDSKCPDGSRFAVPRTALENRYLLQAVQRAGLGRVFVDLNSLDIETCWVIGKDTKCPYVMPPDQTTRTVVVPIVAAIIVLGIAILVLLVKCGANRSASRKRRVGIGRWDYEGVPS